MLTLYKIELYKIFSRPRTFIAFIAITVLIGIVQLGLKTDGKEYIQFILADLENSFTFDGQILNGYFVCFLVLQLLLVHVPLLISLIAADMVSGEANMGTLRLLATKPITRTQFVFAKFAAAATYSLLLLIWIALQGLFVSMLIFGTDDLLILKNHYIVQIKANDIFWRYVGAFGFAFISMVTIASLGFFLSLFAENSIGPIVGTMSIVVIFTILNTMSIPLFKNIQPYLFTTHLASWKEFFDMKVDADNVTIPGSIQSMGKLLYSTLILSAHIILFVGLSIWQFNKKDIVS
jgi:ABC-2 type transport system permease protein